MSKWTIYNKNGEPKLQATGLEFHDTWMGEEFVTVNITSATPIDLEIGDYLIYRGLTYTIYSLPTALKQARSGSYGDAFKYDSVKFSARSTELTEIRFFDIVLEDNNLHYTSLPTFSFYAETVDDFLDRIQANINRDNSKPWFIISPSYSRTMQRYPLPESSSDPDYDEKVERHDAAEDLWESVFGETHTDNPASAARENEKTKVNISIDKKDIFNSLQHIKNSFGLNFITRERTIIVGHEGIVAAETYFQYGKDKGFYEIERTAEADQQIVTKLFAYGSDKNIPTRYYAEFGKKYFVNADSAINPTIGVAVSLSFTPDIINSQNEEYYTVRSSHERTEPETAVDIIRIVTLECDGYTCRGFYHERHNGQGTSGRSYRIQIVSYLVSTGKDFEEPSYNKAKAFAQAVRGKTRVNIIEGIDKKIWPSNHVSYDTSMPNQMAVNVLMLPGFPEESLKTLCDVSYDASTNKTTVSIRKNTESPYKPLMVLDGNQQIGFSEDRLMPYITSPNMDALGVKEGDIHFTEENDDNGLKEICPTVKGMTEDDVFFNGSDAPLDEIVACEIIKDDGAYKTDDPEYEFPDFHITIPNLGFNLYEAAKESGELTISLTDGYCGGRDFKVEVNEENIKQNDDGTWVLKVQRSPDDTLSLMFPYSDAASHGETPIADEPYQIRGKNVSEDGHGDHYVLSGIDIKETSYIWSASMEVLRKSITWLLNNDYTRFTYLPKIDEIYMARQNDEAIASHGAINSMHDTLKSGMLMWFEDEDLDFDGTIFIDTLTIKEDGNKGIPTYEVVLRNDKQVGTLQRVQNQINSLTSFVNSGGGGLTISQIKSLITTYGGEKFLSKIASDVAAGRITFNEGLSLLNQYGLSKNGDAILHDMVFHDAEISGAIGSDNFVSGLVGWHIDRNGNMEGETLHLRSALEVDELRINRQQAQEGDTIFSDNDQIESIEEVIDETDQSVSYILTLKEKWEGYFTAQQYGNIIRGKINTLAAKEAGVSDYSGDEYESSQQTDAGGNKYYTSFMRCIATHNTAPSFLDVNQIQVVLYGDSDVPMTKNYPPCALMTIARWGGFLDPDEQGISADEKEQRRRRQSLFMLSTSDGRIVKLVGVNKPKLENWNFGTTLGELPDFVKNYGNVRERIIAGRDYLYAQGVVVGDFIKVDINGAPVSTPVYCGEWVDGSQMQNPTVGNGIYLKDEYNSETQQYETHEVRHNGGRWLCLQHQPVISGGVSTYYEPKWNSPYWKLVDGNDNLTIEFVSSNGYSFRRGYVDTVITPHLFYGNVEIDADGTEIDAQYWNWTRSSESGKTTADETWDAKHKGLVTGTKTLHLTNNDMPQTWSSANKAIFTCTVSVNDGKTTRIVDNQIIS